LDDAAMNGWLVALLVWLAASTALAFGFAWALGRLSAMDEHRWRHTREREHDG
jgi:hypothetical protein